MNGSNEIQTELDALIREGLDWIMRLKSGEATQADLNEWRNWQAQSPAHAEAFRAALRVRSRLQAAGQNLLRQQDNAAPGRVRMSRRALMGGAMAAASVGWLALRPPLSLWPSVGDVIADLRADYSTAVGERRQIKLASGGSLLLNTQTRVALRTTEDSVGFDLMSGEALFATERGEARPFVIAAGGGLTRIAAGRLNIRSLNERVQVTCLEGQLEVRYRESRITVAHGQQVAYDAAGLREVIDADPQLATAWEAGLLVFKDERLRDVVAEINRYRRGRIVLADAALGERLVNGTFHLAQLDGALSQVQELTGAHARMLPGGIVILS